VLIGFNASAELQLLNSAAADVAPLRYPFRLTHFTIYKDKKHFNPVINDRRTAG
jgi:hypothetical protein